MVQEGGEEGKGVGEGPGPEGEKGGRMRGKGREERRPKPHLRNSDFGTPVIEVVFSGLSKYFRDFPEVFLRTDPGNSHSLLELSDWQGKQICLPDVPENLLECPGLPSPCSLDRLTIIA